MRPTIAADATVRALIAAIPDDRLRELFLELALAALAVPAVVEKQVPHNGRRRSPARAGRHGKGKHKIDRRRRAYLDALNAKRREKREAATLSTGSRRRNSARNPVPSPSPRPMAAQAAGGATVSRYGRAAVGASPQARTADSPGARCHASLASARAPRRRRSAT